MNRATIKLTAVAVVALAVVLGGLWYYFRANLKALDTPLSTTGYSYSASEGAVMAAIAETLAVSPELKEVLTNSTCPDTGPKYNIDPATLANSILTLLGIPAEEGCYKITGNITISPKIYWMSLSRSILVVDATGTVTLQYYDKNCVLQTETITLSSLKIAFSIKNDGSIGGIVPLPGGKPICIIKLPSKNIPISQGNLDPDKCPNCKKPVPDPAIESTIN